MTARLLAVKCLVRIEAQGAYSDLLMDKELERSGLDRRDRAFASLLVQGVLERRITLDACIAPLTKINKLSPPVLAILRTGVYQLLYLPDIPQPAVVNEATQLTRHTGQSRASGLVNGVLRAFLRGGCAVPLPAFPQEERLSVEYSVPTPLARLLLESYGPQKTAAFLERALRPAPLYIRANTVKTDSESLLRALEAAGVGCQPIGLEGCLKLEGGGSIPSLPGFAEGHFHVQDLSSQLCALAVEARPGMQVLDVCAAPGGKSFTIAQWMRSSGRLVACDLHEKRVGLIRQGAERLGLGCITARQGDASQHDPALGQFDRVLCDVPCSGFGIIGRKPEIRYKSLEEIATLPQIQHKILAASSKYTKEGGRLVYSTCTLNPAENEAVVAQFLNENPHFAPAPLPPQLGGGPTSTLMDSGWDCDGFFVAAMTRTAAPQQGRD